MDDMQNKQPDEQQEPQLYQQPQQYQQNQEPLPVKASAGFSVASMVLGIVAVVMSCCIYYIAFPCGVVGLILGALSLRDKKPGKGMAIAGIVMSIVSLALAVIVIVTAGALTAGMTDWLNEMQGQLQ